MKMKTRRKSGIFRNTAKRRKMSETLLKKHAFMPFKAVTGNLLRSTTIVVTKMTQIAMTKAEIHKGIITYVQILKT